MNHGLHWFRADLRITDNTALLHAIKNSDVLLAIFIFTEKTFTLHNAAPIKIQFILNNLKVLSEELMHQGIPLLIQKTNHFSDCSGILNKICLGFKINTLYFNKQYEVDELRRDEAVKKSLREQGIEVYTYDDQTILPLDSLYSKSNKPFQVFTPFKKAWLNKTSEMNFEKTIVSKQKIFTPPIKADEISKIFSETYYTNDMSAWPSGEKQAKKIFIQFHSEKINHYDVNRDFPSLDATSCLSPYLAQGVISPRECFAVIKKDLSSGSAAWLSELIWREFYKYILYHFPQICYYQPLRIQTNNIPWSNNSEYFQAWCEGKTGFPLVDAAMRQLNQTGWMHNRLRMVTAMFLSKILLLDWRLGERYFMSKLIDGDLSANNGGWQWSASTGTDAVPYFRIFNPTRQSERFDPEGLFIRQYCPELGTLNNYTIHDPYARGIKVDALNYPLPIVNYKQKRQEAIATFKNQEKKKPV